MVAHRRPDRSRRTVLTNYRLHGSGGCGRAVWWPLGPPPREPGRSCRPSAHSRGHHGACHRGAVFKTRPGGPRKSCPSPPGLSGWDDVSLDSVDNATRRGAMPATTTRGEHRSTLASSVVAGRTGGRRCWFGTSLDGGKLRRGAVVAARWSGNADCRPLSRGVWSGPARWTTVPRPWIVPTRTNASTGAAGYRSSGSD